jgi:hypothetical protein
MWSTAFKVALWQGSILGVRLESLIQYATNPSAADVKRHRRARQAGDPGDLRGAVGAQTPPRSQMCFVRGLGHGALSGCFTAKLRPWRCSLLSHLSLAAFKQELLGLRFETNVKRCPIQLALFCAFCHSNHIGQAQAV